MVISSTGYVFSSGTKLKRNYRGYFCTRCFADSAYSPRATNAITFLISIVLAFALLGGIQTYFAAKNYTTVRIDCCNSMFPVISTNANGSNSEKGLPCLVVEEYINANDIKIGDIVSYRYGIKENILHRIIGKCTYVGDNYNVTDGMATIFEKSQGYLIRGDNNGISDPFCAPAWSIQSRFKYKLFCLADYVG